MDSVNKRARGVMTTLRRVGGDEVKYLCRSAWRTWIRLSVFIFALSTLAVMALWWKADPLADSRTAGDTILFGVGLVFYNAFFAVQLAMIGAGLRLIWEVVGWWSFVPLLLAPLGLSLAMWLGADMLFHSLGLLFAHAADSHDWLLADLGAFGPAAAHGAGGILVVLVLPIVLIDLGMALFSWKVVLALLLVTIELVLLLAVGLLPSLVSALFLVPIAYYRRLEARHFSRSVKAEG